MEQTDYFQIINKYIEPGSKTYSIYLPHVTLVTTKALKIAQKLNLSEKQLRFIEEAGMLHDIGIVRVKDEYFECAGKLPYICHLSEGAKILESEGLPKHARVAERHAGVGIFKWQIEQQKLLLPPKDYVPETIEEKIIGWSDIFFSKTPRNLFRERSQEEARTVIAKFGKENEKIFDEWQKEFE
ncbi:phosphohydrolase [bacterium]|nr:phosphohydrolase [bacterium]|tara:strand:- start:1756 stop:2307 length:552 start_codon:yes stop_codon:yes gene_type:complete